MRLRQWHRRGVDLDGILGCKALQDTKTGVLHGDDVCPLASKGTLSHAPIELDSNLCPACWQRALPVDAAQIVDLIEQFDMVDNCYARALEDGVTGTGIRSLLVALAELPTDQPLFAEVIERARADMLESFRTAIGSDRSALRSEVYKTHFGGCPVPPGPGTLLFIPATYVYVIYELQESAMLLFAPWWVDEHPADHGILLRAPTPVVDFLWSQFAEINIGGRRVSRAELREDDTDAVIEMALGFLDPQSTLCHLEDALDVARNI